MLFTNTIVGLAAVAVAVVEAAAPAAVTATSSPFKVKVGADGLTYTPSNIIADVGTQIEFDFFPKNHTVTQSSFKDPCHPLSGGGFFSGFVPTGDSPSSTTFTITVQNKSPIWFYCSQTVGTHCQKGMVGAINAPAVGNTLDAFILLASNATQSTFPSGGAAGGVLQVGGSSSNLSSTASTSFTTSVTTAAESTSAIVTTYTSASSTYTATIGSSTIYSTESSVVPAATSSFVPANSASTKSSNLFGVAALLFGAMAMM